MPSRRELLIGAGLLSVLGGAGRLAAAPSPVTVRVGVLPFGTVSWEAQIIREAGLDAPNGLVYEPVRLANNDAARIAFQGGQVDTIVSDLLWAARLRNEGRAVRFVPFSATEGAVMLPPGSPIRTVADLKGKRIGVAGGPLDKSWLLLQAHARESAGIDLGRDAEPSFGAPPLLANKLESGELDAALLYWNFCARLEAKGFRRLIGAGEIARAFGVEGEIALIGYVFDEAITERRADILAAFARTSAAAKNRLATSDEAWNVVRPLMEAPDEATFQTLKRYFLEGIPRRDPARERADAERLYTVLARLGGEKLLGKGTSLPTGLYWTEGRGPT